MLAFQKSGQRKCFMYLQSSVDGNTCWLFELKDGRWVARKATSNYQGRTPKKFRIRYDGSKFTEGRVVSPDIKILVNPPFTQQWCDKVLQQCLQKKISI